MKKELAVAALRNGTVIDHIPCEALFKVVEILGLTDTANSVTIGNNLPSSGMGTKGIIKVADVEFPEDIINRIAIIAPTAVINTVREYEVVKKEPVVLSDEIIDLAVCNNPRCITRNEPMRTIFSVIKNGHDITLRCKYCEHEMSGSNITLK
jgi:aspartate carbamoyltransferase regulatory subunit